MDVCPKWRIKGTQDISATALGSTTNHKVVPDTFVCMTYEYYTWVQKQMSWILKTLKNKYLTMGLSGWNALHFDIYSMTECLPIVLFDTTGSMR